MADIRKVADNFSVAPQLTVDDMLDLTMRGFVLLVNNRPDGEVPDQPDSFTMYCAASSSGIGYEENQFAGRPSDEQAAAQLRAIVELDPEAPAADRARRDLAEITVRPIPMGGESGAPEADRAGPVDTTKGRG